jgi:hypothetical protein
MSNPTQGSGDYTDPQSGYASGTTDPNTTSDPYATNVPYEPTDPNAPAAGGYATTGTYTSDTGGYTDIDTSGSPSTTDVAKDEAGNVKDTAVGAGKQVASTAKEEAANVAGEAKQQAKSLLGTATSQLKDQASAQQGKLASSLRGYTDQLQGLGQGQPLEAGPLNDLVQQAANRGSDFVSWIENREPADLLDELRRYARRRPVMFLVLCGLAGVVAGRITRGAIAANTSVDSASPARAADMGTSTTPYTTTGTDYVAPGSTYGAYTDAPAGTYPTDTTYATETTSAEYADRGDPTR